MKVEDLMTQDVHMVTPERSLKEVAAILSEHRIGGMPVVDERRVALGVITKADIVIKERGQPAEPERRGLFRRKDSGEEAKIAARTAGEAMSSPAITISAQMPVTIAAETMISTGVNRLPVVRRDEVIGIIARHDLVRVFARGDAEITREIREEAMMGVTWPDAIDVRVNDGEVTLRGQADTMLDAETLPLVVRHVLGVVSVDSELSAWDPGSEKTVKVCAHI